MNNKQLEYKFKKVPRWAKDLTIKVVREYNKEIPRITWRRHNAYSSSGATYYDREKGITVRAGKKAKRWEQKLVLLHELAHWIRPVKEHHSPEFWKLAFQLYKENRVPIRKAIKREKDYKKGAENGYRAVMGLKPKKISRKRKEIRRLDKLPIYAVIGIKKDYKGKAWAVTNMVGGGNLKKWNGYKISDGLYKRLLDLGHKEI